MATKSVETLVQEMLDREAIRDLPVRYCHYVWKNDVEGIVNLFTEDGAISVPNDPSLLGAQGRANLLKTYKQALGDLAPRPFIHNHVVELSGRIGPPAPVTSKFALPATVRAGLARATTTTSTPRSEERGSFV